MRADSASPSPRSIVGIALRVGDGHARVAVGLGADATAFLVALGAVLARQLFALAAHARVDVLLGAGRQLGAIDAHVAHLDAELCERRRALVGDRPSSPARARW